LTFAGGKDQPEHEVLFLLAIEETSKNKMKAAMNIIHSRVGVDNGCPQVAAEHNCSTGCLPMAKLIKENPSKRGGAAPG